MTRKPDDRHRWRVERYHSLGRKERMERVPCCICGADKPRGEDCEFCAADEPEPGLRFIGDEL